MTILRFLAYLFAGIGFAWLISYCAALTEPDEDMRQEHVEG